MRPARKKRPSTGLVHGVRDRRAVRMLEELHRSLAQHLPPNSRAAELPVDSNVEAELARPSTSGPTVTTRDCSRGLQKRPSTSDGIRRDAIMQSQRSLHSIPKRREGELRSTQSTPSLQPLSISVLEEKDDSRESPPRINLGALAAHSYPYARATPSVTPCNRNRAYVGSRPKAQYYTDATPSPQHDLLACSRAKLPSVGKSPSEGSNASTRVSSARSSRPCSGLNSGTSTPGQSRQPSVTRSASGTRSRPASLSRAATASQDASRRRPTTAHDNRELGYPSSATGCLLARSILLKAQAQLLMEPMSSPTGSDVAVAGSPAPRAARALGARYAEMAAGKFGSIASEWLQRRLSACEPPTLEEMQAGEAFGNYDRNRDGRLSLQEFGFLLLDSGLETDRAAVRKVIDAAAGEGAESVDIDSYVRYYLSNQRRAHSYSRDETVLMQSVFDSYDINHSGLLEAPEYTALLTDLGREPRTRQESQNLGALIAACRRDGSLGPINFEEFLVLAWRIDNDDNERAVVGEARESPLLGRPRTAPENLKA